MLGFPCNQFGARSRAQPTTSRPSAKGELRGRLPLFEKCDVNGEARHPLYARLSAAADFKGRDGDIQWNFEKFLVAPDGTVAGRFSAKLPPDHPAVVAAIEANLPVS